MPNTATLCTPMWVRVSRWRSSSQASAEARLTKAARAWDPPSCTALRAISCAFHSSRAGQRPA